MLDIALNGIYNLIILDAILPFIGGFEILKIIRENNIDVKIIMLTAKSELEDNLNGFNYGTDDYINKKLYLTM